MDDRGSHGPLAQPLAEASAELARVLARPLIRAPLQYSTSQIRCQTLMVSMRDGMRLATDVYLPPSLPAPAIALRTPYGRGADAVTGAILSFVRRGYVVVSQDCRGTGDSEPETWEYNVYEAEDSVDFVEWVSSQEWFDGFLGACGGSYSGSMQWHMALHPKTSTIVPEVAGLGIRGSPLKGHMFVNAYAKSIGKGKDKVSVSLVDLERRMLDETLASGYFNAGLSDPIPDILLEQFPDLRGISGEKARTRLWEHYCELTCSQRAEFIKQAFGVDHVTILEAEAWGCIFGSDRSPYAPALSRERLLQALKLPVLLNTGWYDWGLDDTLATWEMLRRKGQLEVRSGYRLFIAPSAHNVPGYHEGMAQHPALGHAHRMTTSVELLLRWYESVRERTLDSWPTVIFYLMGANEWYCADEWPVPGAQSVKLYLRDCGCLSAEPPPEVSPPDQYTYDPEKPTPTVGGSIVSYVFTPGSVDVSEVQKRSDVLVYTTEQLLGDLDVVGPLRLVLYMSSSAVDTDFVARLSDVFPDGRAIQLQNGILRTRFRHSEGAPELLEPGKVYRLEIDMWATANRFRAGHRIRIDISSADFPRFERHSNRVGEGPPVQARQIIYHDQRYPSHVLLPVLNGRVP